VQVNVSGTMNFSGGSIQNPAGVFANGTLTIVNGPSIGTYPGSNPNPIGLLVNNGTATWNSGNLNFGGNGIFSNAPGATLNWNTGSTSGNGYFGNFFYNAGQINVTAGSGNTANMSTPFYNFGTGTVNVISGVFALTGGGTDSESGGGITIASGTSLNVENNYTFNTGSTITGAGDVTASGG